MKPVLLVDCYLDPPGAARWFTPWIGLARVVRPSDGERADPAEARAVIVTGSAASVPEHPDWLAPLGELLRGAVDADVPVLGVCFGHQALAWAMWGDPAVFRRTTPEVGWPEIERAADPLLGAFPSRFRTFVSHEDEVRPMPGMRVLASTPACPVHAFRVGDRRAWGLQFHVEYGAEEEERIVRYRAVRHPELGLAPDALLAGARRDPTLAPALFRAFLAS